MNKTIKKIIEDNKLKLEKMRVFSNSRKFYVIFNLEDETMEAINTYNTTKKGAMKWLKYQFGGNINERETRGQNN